ncbi:MAG: hypothetical protein V4503_01400 [Gemmatimonadota bacterium]
MNRWHLLPTALLLAAAAPLSAQTAAAPTVSASAPLKLTPADEKRLFDAGQRYTRWFLAGRADSLMGVLSAETATQINGIEGIRDMMGQVAERAGVETEMTEEKLTRRNGYPQFWHAAKFRDFTDDELVLRWVMELDGKVRGIGFGPKSRSPEPDPS